MGGMVGTCDFTAIVDQVIRLLIYHLSNKERMDGWHELYVAFNDIVWSLAKAWTVVQLRLNLKEIY